MAASGMKRRHATHFLSPALHISALFLAQLAEARKGAALVFEAEKGFQGAASKRVSEHARRVANDEQRVVCKSRRHMTQLHPALGPPPHKLGLFSRDVLGLHHRRRAVVLFQALV